MASHVLTDCGVYVNELDLSGQSNSVEAMLEAEELDASVFGNSGFSTTVAGLKTGTFNQSGFMDFTLGLDQSLTAAMGSSSNVATVTNETTLGSFAWLMKGSLFTASPVSAQVGQLAVLNSTLKSASGSYGLRPGKLLANKAARGATASTTGVQLFTSGTVTLLTASLHVFSGSGSTVVTVQSSATQGGSYTTRGTFTAATAATYEFISATGSWTDQWWRATFTVGSGTTTAAVSAAVS